MAQAVVRRRVEMEAGCWDLVISDFRARKPRDWRSEEVEPSLPRPFRLTVESAHRYFFSLGSVSSLLRKSVAATGDPDEHKGDYYINPDLGMPHASLKRGSVTSGLSSWPQWLDALATRGDEKGKPIPPSVLRAYRRAVEQRVQQALFPAGKLRRLLPPTPYQPPLRPTLHRVVDTPNMLVHLGRFLDLASLCRLRAVSRGVSESLTGEPHLWEDVRFPAWTQGAPLEWRHVSPIIDFAAGGLKVRFCLMNKESYLSSWDPFGSSSDGIH
jgi:hypothetical protein